MGAPKSLQEMTIYFSWCTPTFRRTQHDHWPVRPARCAAGTTFLLMRSNFCDAMFHRGCHSLVHAFVIRSLDEVRRPPVTLHEVFQLLVADAREKSRIINLVAVQVKNGQDRSVSDRVQEFVDVPRSCQRAGFRFTITDDSRDNQVRIVERSPAGVGEHVSQFASFVDRTRSLRRAVTADAARERKLSEELVQATFVFALFRIDLRVGSLKIAWPQDTGRAMSRTGHENHVQVELLDQAVQVDVDGTRVQGLSPSGRAAGS